MASQPTPRPPLPAIAAIVTTFNEEQNIAGCIESLLWCDEILVVDSFSTDRTPEIVRGYPKVRFLQRTYYGSASQKNWAMDQVQHDWIVIFDADERCTPALQKEIETLLASGPTREAYTIKRRVHFLGKVIHFSGWQHDRVVRLVKRGLARYPNRRVHADMLTRDRSPILRNPMEHFMTDTLDEYMRRIEKYSFWGASQQWKEGKKAGFVEVLGRSLWRFLRTYVFQLGILDGMHGLVFCMLQSYGTYRKWSLLWGWHTNAARGHLPTLPIFDEDEAIWRGLEDVRAWRPAPPLAPASRAPSSPLPASRASSAALPAGPPPPSPAAASPAPAVLASHGGRDPRA
ncbi:MAG TPA: glycosyltransferase family 2 protein [Thermoanaerobaculia bacterium]|nr:glycosyltransferase family 2 protein [Thermoanaerobaculia bacterium]